MKHIRPFYLAAAFIAASLLTLVAAPLRDAHALDRVIGTSTFQMVGTVNQQGNQHGATSVFHLPSSAATTNATSVKASAGTVYSIEAYNATAVLRYLKVYDKASAPTVGTDTPKRTIALKPNDRTVITFVSGGLSMPTGIALALTLNPADSDSTAITATDVVGLNVDYQ